MFRPPTSRITHAIVQSCRPGTRPRCFSALTSTHKSSASTPAWQNPTRGGQNLTSRYRRLEKSLRGKESYASEIEELKSEAAGMSAEPRMSPAKSNVQTFMGFVVPLEPQPPGPDECCMSGCAVCVQDLYVEALDEYKLAVDSLRTSLRTLRVPEDEWPAHIQTTHSQPTKKPNPVFDAFAEFEARLKRKQQDTQAGAERPVLLSRRVRGKKTELFDPSSLYEGLRWMLFSNR